MPRPLLATGAPSRHSRGRVVEPGLLAERLLLFPTVILDSAALTEAPHIAKAFGLDATLSLIGDGSIRFYLPRGVVAQTSRTESKPKYSIYQNLHYRFGTIEFADWDRMVANRLERICASTDLDPKDSQKLADAVSLQLIRPQEREGREAANQLQADLRRNDPLLAAALRAHFARNGLLGATKIRFEEVEPETFRAHLDGGIGDASKLDNMISGALLGVGRLNTGLEMMMRHDVVVGFRPDEYELLASKVSSLVPRELKDEDSIRDTFHQTVDLAGLPALHDFFRDVDVARLLEVRKSQGCLDFRAWLDSAPTMSTEEIRREVTSWSKRVSKGLVATSGKILRFGVLTGLGAIPEVGWGAGLALGVLDSFLLEKVLPKPRVLAFLANEYKSVFKSE